jgi:hypothetical protein
MAGINIVGLAFVMLIGLFLYAGLQELGLYMARKKKS